jgi:hypothetical protein
MKLCIADPPYLGRAVRHYGINGRAYGRGKGKSDTHPEAHIWDDPETHKKLIYELQNNFEGWAIAMSVHSLSTYLEIIETQSENGIRVCVWHKPNAIPSGSRIINHWEPVLIKVPKDRKGRTKGQMTTDVLTANAPRIGFSGSKPKEWTYWVLDLLGYQEGDEVVDLFHGSGAVTQAISQMRLFT